MKLLARVALTSIGVVIGTAAGGVIGFFVPMLLGMLFQLLTRDPTAGGAFWISMFFTVPGGVIGGAVGGGYLANLMADRFTPLLNESPPVVRSAVRATIAGIAGYIAGGFVAGAMSIDDPFTPRNPMTILASGLYGSATFVATPGRALSLDGDRLINAWPHFFACWIVFYLAIALWSRFGEVRRPREAAEVDAFGNRIGRKPP
jgi:hypothetical protein